MKVSLYIIVFSLLLISENRLIGQGTEVDQLFGLVKAEDYKQAAISAKQIARTGTPEQQLEAFAIYGHILLGAGKKNLFPNYAKSLAGKRLSDSQVGDLTKVYETWIKLFSPEKDQAIETLREMTDDSDNRVAGEATFVLTGYLLEKQPDQIEGLIGKSLAKLAYDGAGELYLNDLLKRRLMEAKKKMKSPWQTLYEKGESHRAKERFAKAIPIYEKILADCDEALYLDLAGLRKGESLLGLDQYETAKAYFKEDYFENEIARPYRGQAVLKLADYELKKNYDVDAARETLALSEEVIETVFDDSWERVQFDLTVRLGLVAYVRNNETGVKKWFTLAKSLYKPKQPILIAKGTVKKPVDPFTKLHQKLAFGKQLTEKQYREGNSTVSLLTVLGDYFYYIREMEEGRDYFLKVLDHPKSSKAQLAYADMKILEFHWQDDDFEKWLAKAEKFLKKYKGPQSLRLKVLHKCGQGCNNRFHDTDRSLGFMKRVMKEASQSSEEYRKALYSSGTINMFGKRNEEAARCYQQYMDLYPDHYLTKQVLRTRVPQLLAGEEVTR